MSGSKELGMRISNLLKAQGMTQKQLAERTGATEAAISKYIKGEREPRAEILANIATVLGTTSESLLGMQDNIETSFGSVKMLCARTAADMTQEEKSDLIMTILQATNEERP